MKRAFVCLLVSGIFFVFAGAALAANYDGTPIKSGKATFTYNGKDYTYTFAEGGLKQMKNFTMATLVFKPKPTISNITDDHLNVVVMYTAPGKVDLDSAFSMNGVSMFSHGTVSRFTTGKSKGALTITKATAAEVEGTGDFTLMHSISGGVVPPVKNLKFYAKTK